MAVLEFVLNGHKITIEGVPLSQASFYIEAMAEVFDRIARDDARDNAERFTTPALKEWVKQLTGKARPKVVDIFPIASESRPWKFHAVRHYGNGIMVCPCEGFEHRGQCRHIPLAVEQLRIKRGYQR